MQPEHEPPEGEPDSMVVAEAARRFGDLPDVVRQMALAREIVATRTQELKLAYPNVVMVAAGYRSRRAEDGAHEVHPQPCVILVVRRKWRSDEGGHAHGRLPRHLLTYGMLRGRHVLYAVPTDVQPAAWFGTGRARTGSSVRVSGDAPGTGVHGTLTCGVELRTAAGGVHALVLSAMHVFTPWLQQMQPAAGRSFAPSGADGDDGDAVGHSTAWGGHINRGVGLSFDAQLAELNDPQWFNDALRPWALSASRPFVLTPADFDGLAHRMRFQILVPGNRPRHRALPRRPMLAQFTATVGQDQALAYTVRYAGNQHTRLRVRHKELVCLRVLPDAPAPEDGDSGAAVVTWWPDGSAVLAGMLIASGDAPAQRRTAYVLPSWHLFDPAMWRTLPDSVVSMEPVFRLRMSEGP